MKLHFITTALLAILLMSCSKNADLNNSWEMSEYLGEPINYTIFSVKTPELKLNTEDETFSGNNGCNLINGKISVHDNKININTLLSTKMFCQGIPEQEFEAQLSSVDNFVIESNSLYLKKEDITLFVFQKKDE